MKRFLGLLVLLAGVLTSAAAGAGDLIVSRAILEDPDGLLTIGEVVGRGEFRPVEAIPSHGYTNDTLWIRLEVAAPERGNEVVLRVKPAYIDEIRLFAPDPDTPNGWKIRVTGDRYPYEERDRVAVALGFVVNVPVAGQVFYLRMRTTSSSHLYLEGLEPRDAQRKDYRDLIRDVFFLTVMMLMLMWGIQHEFADRKAVLGWFCLYQGTYILFMISMTGYMGLLMPPGHSEWSDQVTSILVCGVTFTLNLFSRSLFRAYSPPRWVTYGFNVLLATFPLEMFAMAWGLVGGALHFNAIMTAVSLLYGAVTALVLREGPSPRRRYVFAAYLGMAVSAGLPLLANLGVSNKVDAIMGHEWPLMTHGLIGSLLLVLLLQARLNRLHAESRRAALDLAMVQKTLELEHSLKEQAEAQARTDFLTGLFNRRHFVELAERELDRAMRYKRPLTMLMVDIDHFKAVNDTRGHATGDLVLQEVARLIRAAVRSVDIVGRIGGEEFAAVLLEMDEATARDVAERVRRMVEDASIAVPEGVPVKVTISIGIAHLRGRNANLDTLLSEADTAMYSAKQGGRNSVVVSEN